MIKLKLLKKEIPDSHVLHRPEDTLVTFEDKDGNTMQFMGLHIWSHYPSMQSLDSPQSLKMGLFILRAKIGDVFDYNEIEIPHGVLK